MVLSPQGDRAATAHQIGMHGRQCTSIKKAHHHIVKKNLRQICIPKGPMGSMASDDVHGALVHGLSVELFGPWGDHRVAAVPPPPQGGEGPGTCRLE